MLGGIVLVIAGSLYYWLNGGRFVSIDDAYVRAAKVSVSTDVSAPVAEVPVHEGQLVKQGDVLFRLDPHQFEIAVRGAQAKLAETALNLSAMKRDYIRMQRDVATREAMVQADQARFARYASLVNKGDVPRQDYDDARFKMAADQAGARIREAAGRGAARPAGRQPRRGRDHACRPTRRGRPIWPRRSASSTTPWSARPSPAW